MNSKNNTYGKPKRLYCPICNRETIHFTDCFSYAVENSFMPNYKALLIDISYKCNDCKAIHKMFDTYHVEDKEGAIEEFEKTVENNMRDKDVSD